MTNSEIVIDAVFGKKTANNLAYRFLILVWGLGSNCAFWDFVSRTATSNMFSDQDVEDETTS